MNKSIKGYIYIFSNPSFEHIKIGYSDRDPLIRLDELNTTGVPTPFVLEFSALVHQPKTVEKLIHLELSNYRLNPDREFFTLPVNIAVVRIKEIMQINNISIMFEESRISSSFSNKNLNTSSDSWPFAGSADKHDVPDLEKKIIYEEKIPDDFYKIFNPSIELAEIVGSSPLRRSEVVSKLWTYIKQNNLNDKVNKGCIYTDSQLRKIFGNKEKMTMFEVSSWISKHLSD